jgi:hypothetical protein
MHGEFNIVRKVDLGLAHCAELVSNFCLSEFCRTSLIDALFLRKIFSFFLHKFVKMFQNLS